MENRNMACKKKIYGHGFRIIGSKDGWDIGVWTDSYPSALVMLKPINKKDFIFCCLDSMRNGKQDNFCGVVSILWYSCLNNTITELKSEKEAQALLAKKT